MVWRNIEHLDVRKRRWDLRGFPAFGRHLGKSPMASYRFCEVKARTVGKEILLRELITSDLDRTHHLLRWEWGPKHPSQDSGQNEHSHRSNSPLQWHHARGSCRLL